MWALWGRGGFSRPSLPRCVLQLQPGKAKLSGALSLSLPGAFFFYPSPPFFQISLQLSKQMGETLEQGCGAGEGSEWAYRSPGETYLVPELVCALRLQEPKSWNLLVERKVLYQKHIGCRRSCALPRSRWFKTRKEEDQSPDLAGQGETPAEAPGILG